MKVLLIKKRTTRNS